MNTNHINPATQCETHGKNVNIAHNKVTKKKSSSKTHLNSSCTYTKSKVSKAQKARRQQLKNIHNTPENFKDLHLLLSLSSLRHGGRLMLFNVFFSYTAQSASYSRCMCVFVLCQLYILHVVCTSGRLPVCIVCA